MLKTINNKTLFKIFGIALAILTFVFFINPIDLFSQTVFYNFQARDIARAREILNGHIMFYGPEMTGGGNLPGPLYYFTLAIGQFFDYTWRSAWVIQFLFATIAALIGFEYLKKQNIFIRYAWIILFATAPFTSWFLKAFLNVSYLIPFSVFAITTICRSFDKNKDQSNRKLNLYLAFLSIGIGLQFHFSIVCFLFAILILQFIAKKFLLPKFETKELFLGFIIFLVPSIPHIIWLISHRLGYNFGLPSFYSGNPEQSIVSIIYLIKLNLNTSIFKLLASWGKKLSITIPFVLIPILITSFYERRSHQIKHNIPLIVCLIVSSFSYLNWYVSGQAIRYTIPFYTTLLFLTINYFIIVLNNQKWIKTFNLCSIVTLVLILIYGFSDLENKDYILFLFSLILISTMVFSISYFSIKERQEKGLSFSVALILFSLLCYSQRVLISEERVFNQKKQEGYLLTYSEWKSIINTIYQNTGWTIDEIKYQIYYVGHHVNQAPHLAFETMKNQLPLISATPIRPDGFIISNRFGALSADENGRAASPTRWLLKQNLHKNVEDAIKSGDIKLGKNISKNNLIIPYWVVNTQKIPKHFHNSSAGYFVSSEDLSLQAVQANEGVIKLNNNEYLFKWNECPDHHYYCSTGAKINLIKVSTENFKIHVRVIGSTISQITPWISPNWTQSWDEPFVEVKCGGKIQNFSIAESIGFNRKYSHFASRTPFFSGNNSFTAPLDREISFSCASTPELLTVGRQGSTIDMITKSFSISSKKLSIAL